MPIYEYVCDSCGHQLEARQRLSDDPLTDCPSCHQSRLERLVSNTSFSLKGGGWYADGYGKGKTETASTTDTNASSSKDASTDSPKTSSVKSPPSAPANGDQTSGKAEKKSAAGSINR